MYDRAINAPKQSKSKAYKKKKSIFFSQHTEIQIVVLGANNASQLGDLSEYRHSHCHDPLCVPLPPMLCGI